jgi:hypothetical protein
MEPSFGRWLLHQFYRMYLGFSIKIVGSARSGSRIARGALIIGVEDDGKVHGLHEDYKLSGNNGRDGFEN